ncbi:hypothetical protein PoB_001411300 [Plakobranchus ocellatus]|uniref:Uncharacterized protein n=1 Tax=Plakobranchus ocellatus TaxID=259542 RepID=A0AAV3YZE4_9GAST|nr:hypothetical protein PoB_001411300 [Plakobranchus ocellatus]
MELRSGTKVHLSRDYFPANAYRDPYNLYTPLKRPQRIKREAKALNLLNVIGEVREGLRQPEAITHTYISHQGRPWWHGSHPTHPEMWRDLSVMNSTLL